MCNATFFLLPFLALNSELLSTGEFDVMSLSTDEDEHSIEMHLPYVARVMEDKRDRFTIVPILVGSLSHEKQESRK
jgi:AmmeMemoRadiSam system protein B